LRLNVPLGIEEADHEVCVTVEHLPVRQQMTQLEWAAWVESLAGSWQGDFERPPQGNFAAKEPLS
jgi:hypothetical protein